jgi:hypothetical protein
MGQQCAVINAGSLFHLFDEATQVTLAKRLLHLLARRPDALIMGGASHIIRNGEPTSGAHRPGRRRRRGRGSPAVVLQSHVYRQPSLGGTLPAFAVELEGALGRLGPTSPMRGRARRHVVGRRAGGSGATAGSSIGVERDARHVKV